VVDAIVVVTAARVGALVVTTDPADLTALASASASRLRLFVV